MGIEDFSQFEQSLVNDASCGPDLDSAGDDDFMNFVARVEGVLPPVFAEFDRASIDFAFETREAGKLLLRSRDLRILVLLAKLMVLDRRLEDFADVVLGISALLDQRWDSVHPAGDNEYRRGILMALDDMPHCSMPLQSIPLFESRNLGRVTYRHFLLATGASQPRENESSFQASVVATALERAEQDEIATSYRSLTRLQAGLAGIASAFAKNLGAGKDLALPNLRKLAADQAAWLGAELARRDPASAAAAATPGSQEDAANPAAAPGNIASHAQATQALDAIAAYLARHEPSSVGLLLVRQCRKLSSVSFVEAMRMLVPESLPAATIRIGKGAGFNLPMERLGEIEASEDETLYAGEAAQPEDDNIEVAEPVAEDDSDEATDSPSGDDSSDDGEGSDEQTDGDAPADEPVAREPSSQPGSTGRFAAVTSQRQAIDLMGHVADFYRAREPSSPMPLLLERARALMGRDFLAILEEMLPASHTLTRRQTPETAGEQRPALDSVNRRQKE